MDCRLKYAGKCGIIKSAKEMITNYFLTAAGAGNACKIH